MNQVSRAFTSMPYRFVLRIILPYIYFIVCQLAPAQSTWDTGGAPSLNWSSFTNWNDDADPTGKTLTFAASGATLSGVTSIVDASITIGALTINQNSNTLGHVIQINDGQTLTLNGVSAGNVLLVGGLVPNLSYTKATITSQTPGQASLVVNNSTANFAVYQAVANNANSTGTAILDLSGLGSFTANVQHFRVAASSGNSTGQLTLAAGTNTITASTIQVGVSTTTFSPNNFIKLGQTNTFNTDTLVVGGARPESSISYPGAGTASWRLRDKTGTTRTANVFLGDVRNSSTLAGGGGGSSTCIGTVDATNTNLDWQVGNVYLGTGGTVGSNNDGAGVGILNFAQGTIDVTTLHLGRVSDDGSAFTTQDSTTTGTMSMSGGTLLAGSIVLGENLDGASGLNHATAGVFNLSGGTVTVTSNILMSQHGSTSTRGAAATLNLTGGTLTVNTNIVTDTEATNTDTIIVDGGTLDMTIGNIGSAAAPIDTFTFASGTIKNIAQFNGGGALTKSTAGIGILSGTNTFTGALNVSAGTLRANGALNGLASVNVSANATLAGNGSIRPSGSGTVNVASTGNLAPGDGGIGTLTIDSSTSSAANVVSLASGAKITFELNAGLQSDKVALIGGAAGDIFFGGNTIDFTDLSGGTLTQGVYTLFTANLANAYSGLTVNGGGFITSGLSIGTGLESYGSNLQVVGNDIVLNIVPEPGIAASLLFGVVLLAVRRSSTSPVRRQF